VPSSRRFLEGAGAAYLRQLVAELHDVRARSGEAVSSLVVTSDHCWIRRDGEFGCLA